MGLAALQFRLFLESTNIELHKLHHPFTTKQAKDAYEYILEKKPKCKRNLFDGEWLDEWLAWLDEHKYLFCNYENGKLDGVITIFPIIRYKTTPSISTIIRNININSSTKDFYIMDALVDNSNARVKIIQKILSKYPEIENDPECQLWACRNGKVKKLNKTKILTLKNNGY